MEGRHVQVTVISAEDLKGVNLIGKMHAYALVWIDPDCRRSTAVDEHGGKNPTWNQQLSFPLPERFFQLPDACLTIEIYSKSTFFDDKFVGVASIPVSEIAFKASQEEASTYEVRRRSGKTKGSVRLAIRVEEKTAIGAVPAAGHVHEQRPYDGAGEMAHTYPPSEACVPAGAPYGYPAPYPPQAAPYGQGYYQPAPYHGHGYNQPSPYYQGQPPPPYYQAQPPPQQQPGGGGLGSGMGAGLVAGAVGGAVGGLILADVVDDIGDGDGDDGGFES